MQTHWENADPLGIIVQPKVLGEGVFRPGHHKTKVSGHLGASCYLGSNFTDRTTVAAGICPQLYIICLIQHYRSRSTASIRTSAGTLPRTTSPGLKNTGVDKTLGLYIIYLGHRSARIFGSVSYSSKYSYSRITAWQFVACYDGCQPQTECKFYIGSFDERHRQRTCKKLTATSLFWPKLDLQETEPAKSDLSGLWRNYRKAGRTSNVHQKNGKKDPT
ncbi:hypothetical protein DFH06DRAFT_1140008 [Mycena polygramma]|nr:hypothetical protein DFH06DRAFT_1140008 [Mycena polygramma]